MLEQVNLIWKLSIFSPCLCRLKTFGNDRTNHTRYEHPVKTLGSFMIRLSSRSAGVTGNRADDFLLQFTTTKWLLRASAEAQSCELEGSVIIPQGQWLFWGTGTVCGAPYNLIVVLCLCTLRSFWRTSRLISSLHNCLHWVLSGIKLKRLYAPGPHLTVELKLGRHQNPWAGSIPKMQEVVIIWVSEDKRL